MVNTDNFKLQWNIQYNTIIQELNFNIIIKGKLHFIIIILFLSKIKTEKCINCDSRGLGCIFMPTSSTRPNS